MEINMSKADGYAVVLDDKGSPYGYWFVGAWNTQESAEIALKGQKGNGRIVPLYFRPEAAATGYVVRKEIMDFLHGIAPHPETGVWFGDGEETNKGRYWWRRILRDEIEQSTPQKETP
jgi:hypothetical protein